MGEVLPSNTVVVLLGLGHSNTHVLRKWRVSGPPTTRLVCVSDHAVAAYSGMLAGRLAGQYGRDDMRIDLGRLCATAGAELMVDEVTGLDLDGQRLLLAGHGGVRFDLLSVGVGSVPARDATVIRDDTVLPIKPMQDFVERFDARVAAITTRPLRLLVVGGGAGGLEVTFCAPRRIHGEVAVTLVDGGDGRGGLSPAAARRVRAELDRRGVRVLGGRRVLRAAGGRVSLDDGSTLEADLVLWATSAAPAPVLDRLGLPRGADGFLAIDEHLRVLVRPPVLAAGDCATIQDSRIRLPRAGVIAVREGPVLWTNILRTLRGDPPTRYRPQRRFLKLLNTGDGRAILDYGGVAAHARWCWHLKDRIDRRFIARYR